MMPEVCAQDYCRIARLLGFADVILADRKTDRNIIGFHDWRLHDEACIVRHKDDSWEFFHLLNVSTDRQSVLQAEANSMMAFRWLKLNCACSVRALAVGNEAFRWYIRGVFKKRYTVRGDGDLFGAAIFSALLNLCNQLGVK